MKLVVNGTDVEVDDRYGRDHDFLPTSDHQNSPGLIA
jgi:hypothetical protein